MFRLVQVMPTEGSQRPGGARAWQVQQEGDCGWGMVYKGKGARSQVQLLMGRRGCEAD